MGPTADPGGPPFEGAALRAARTLRRMSPQELAERIDVSRQYVHLLEGNDRRPSALVVEGLARILGVQPRFFAQTPAARLRAAEPFFRSNSRKRMRDQAQATTCLDRYIDLVEYLARDVVFPTRELPRFHGGAVERIEEAAAATRAALGLGADNPIANVVRAVERGGVFVTDLHGIDPAVDAFSASGKPAVIARSMAKESTSRLRFDVSHELGHLVLHAKAEPGNKLLEDEANLFAGAFLLPRDAFLAEFPAPSRQFWSQLVALKPRWGASLQAMLMRARALGRIGDETLHAAMRYISARGWRRAEPLEPAPETPELLTLAIQKLAAARRVQPRDILNELGWSEVLLECVVGSEIAEQLLGTSDGLVIDIRTKRRIEPT